MKRTFLYLTCALVSASLLGGCGYMRSKLGNDQDAYKSSGQVRPLEVPPDLDMPNMSGTLVIPERVATSADASARNAPGVDATAPTMGAGVAISADGLRVADSVQSTWLRVGLALERSGVAMIESRDASAHTYQVRGSGQVTQRAGWLKRTVTFGRADAKKVQTSVTLGVRVSADGDGSRVTIEGAAGEAEQNAAREILDVLRQRLS